jgi:hypothetical protein
MKQRIDEKNFFHYMEKKLRPGEDSTKETGRMSMHPLEGDKAGPQKTLFSFKGGMTTILSTVLHSLRQSLHRPMGAWQDLQMHPFALLIDGENLSAELAVSLLAEAGKFGSLPIRRVYGNWSHPGMKRWQEMVIHYGMTPVQHHLPTTGKNATDIALVVDAMELYARGMRRFCLASSDSDYTPLVRRLREYGCFVVGIGKPETLPALKQACTVFVPTDHLLPPSLYAREVLPPQSAPALPGEIPDRGIEQQASSVAGPLPPAAETMPLQLLLLRAYAQATEEKGEAWVTLTMLGSKLRQLDGQFKVKTHGASRLKDLVERYPHLFQVQMLTEGQAAIRLKAGEEELIDDTHNQNEGKETSR